MPSVENPTYHPARSVSGIKSNENGSLHDIAHSLNTSYMSPLKSQRTKEHIDDGQKHCQ